MAYDPYKNSQIIDLGDGDIVVERATIQPASNPSYRWLHTVLEGETIQSIAYRYYGDSGHWMDICDINSIYDPFEELTVGMELYIP